MRIPSRPAPADTPKSVGGQPWWPPGPTVVVPGSGTRPSAGHPRKRRRRGGPATRYRARRRTPRPDGRKQHRYAGFRTPDRPSDPDSGRTHAVVTEHRDGRLRGYRGVQGFVCLVLRPR
ncbi:hypothetical protein SHO565_71330 [Streptomyces sp. HO565]